MRYTREEIIKDNAAKFVEKCEKLAIRHINYADYVIFEFDNAPPELKLLCNYNGGDEDWMVIARKEPERPVWWLLYTDSCLEPDIYILDNVIIYIGSHA